LQLLKFLRSDRRFAEQVFVRIALLALPLLQAGDLFPQSQNFTPVRHSLPTFTASPLKCLSPT
jgi:hypothetical protein